MGNTAAATFSGGASAATRTAFDSNAPVLTFAASPGVLPASNGRISDGGLNASNPKIPSDGFGLGTVANGGVLQYENAEAWESLKINFRDANGGVNTDVKITNAANSLRSATLGAAAANQIRIIDISDATHIDVTTNFDSNGDRTVIGNTDAAIFGASVHDPARGFTPNRRDPSTGWADEAYTVVREHHARDGQNAVTSANSGQVAFDRIMARPVADREAEYHAILREGGHAPPVHGDAVPSGSYTVTYQAVDLAGNVSNALTATNVWVDNENPRFEKYAPAPIDNVVNETTVKPEYVLSEDVSVLELTVTPVTTQGVALRDTLAPRVINASGSLLTAGSAHVLPVPVSSLVDDQVYSFSYRLRDIAGNWTTIDDAVNRTFDKQYIVPTIGQFVITLDDTEQLAGEGNGATIQAKAADGRIATTYEGTATLTLNCADLQAKACPHCLERAFPACDDVSITGPGVTKNANGTWALDENWDALGSRRVALANNKATIEFTLTATDTTSSGGPY